LACLALALLLAGMSVAGRFAAEEDEPMKDPQQHNHQAWQASPYGRNWQAEADKISNLPQRHRERQRHTAYLPQCHRDAENIKDYKKFSGMNEDRLPLNCFLSFPLSLCGSVAYMRNNLQGGE
jgi:Ni/Co efflux regulator RcnB